MQRNLYDYYNAGGLLPYLSDRIVRALLPLVYGAPLFLIEDSRFWIIFFFPMIESMIHIFRTAKELPGILTAKKMYSLINIPDDLLRCTPRPIVSLKFKGVGIIDDEQDFGSIPGSLDSFMIDISNAGLIPANVPRPVLNVLKMSIHRTLRANMTVKMSLLIQILLELVLWPCRVFGGLLAILVEYVPEFWNNPSSLMRRKFRPSIMYKFRGYYELEFETIGRIKNQEKEIKEFLDEFPSPILESVSKFISGLMVIPAIYLIINGPWSVFSGLVALITILYISNNLTDKHSYNPGPISGKIAKKFKLNPDDIIGIRDFVLEETNRTFVDIIMSILGIVFMPFFLMSLLQMSQDMMEVISRRVYSLEGTSGLFCSTKDYRHIAYSRQDTDLPQMMDDRLSESLAEYSEFLNRTDPY